MDSGTSQSASRTYSIVGDKTVQVMSQNDQGAKSDWTSYSFSCADHPTPTECPSGYEMKNGTCSAIGCPIGYVLQGTACFFSACPSGYVLQGTQCVQTNSCTTPNYCQGNDLLDGCTGETIQQCQWGCTAGRCNGIPAPGATLKAVPSLVKRGDTTQVSWTSSNVTACTVTSTKDSWTCLNGTQTSHPITSQTTFTLHCNGYAGASPSAISRSVIVNIAPTYQEQ